MKNEKQKEQVLDKKNFHGRKDLTPYNAVNNIRKKDANVVYK